MSRAISSVVAVAGLGAGVAAQPVPVSLVAADPAGGRIVEFMVRGSGVTTRPLASGAPLVEPVALLRHEGAVLIADRAADAVWLYHEETWQFRAAVAAPGAGGLDEPVDMAVVYDPTAQVLVLSGSTGAVHRFDRTSGQHLGVAVAPRGRASGLALTYTPSPESRPQVSISYPDAGEVLRFDVRTGAEVGTLARALESPRIVGKSGRETIYCAEERAVLPVRILDLPFPGTPGVIATLPPGIRALDLLAGEGSRLYIASGEGLAFVNQGAFGGHFVAEPGASVWALLADGGECYADCDTSNRFGTLDVFDYLCFMNRFDNGHAYACGCDTSTGTGVCDIFDFICYQNAFVFGCL